MFALVTVYSVFLNSVFCMDQFVRYTRDCSVQTKRGSMNFLVIAAMAAGAVYLVGALILRLGVARTKRIPGVDADKPHPTVSVVIAARDEEEHIGACLEALRKQTYPTHLWSVLVVNDRSTDRTADVVNDMARDWPQLSLLTVQDTDPGLGGKQHALAEGIATTSGEIIAMTDADCIPPPEWIASLAEDFTPGVGVVAGSAAFAQDGRFWHALQQAELSFLLGAAWGFIGLGAPFSAIGNNLAIRRTTYDEIGGYRGLGRTIAEDCALLQRISRITSWQIRWESSPRATVQTNPVPTVGEYLRQRTRWADGIRYIHVWQRALFAAVLVQRLTVGAVSIAAMVGAVQPWWAVGVWAAWLAGDAIVVSGIVGALHRRYLLLLTPAMTLWQTIYQVIVGVRTVFQDGETVWKGISYRQG